MDAKILKSLTLCPVFYDLCETEIDELMSGVNYRVAHIDKGAVYALEGDICRNVDIVIAGTLGSVLKLCGDVKISCT